MRSFWILLVLLSGLALPGRTRPLRLRLVSWNLTRLVDDQGPGAIPTGFLVARLDAVGACLKRLDADLVVLSGLENRDLLARLALRGDYPWWVLSQSGRLEVGVLSRARPSGIRRHRSLPVVEVEFAEPLPLAVLGVGEGVTGLAARQLTGWLQEVAPPGLAVLGDVPERLHPALVDPLAGLPWEFRSSTGVSAPQHIYLSRPLLAHLVPGSYRVVRPRGAEDLSLHLPLQADLQIPVNSKRPRPGGKTLPGKRGSGRGGGRS